MLPFLTGISLLYSVALTVLVQLIVALISQCVELMVSLTFRHVTLGAMKLGLT